MSEESKSPASSLSPEGISKIVERLGLPTIIVCVVGYVGYQEVLKPISVKYAEMLEGVTASNQELTKITDELREKLIELGGSNSVKMDAILKAGERAGDGQDEIKDTLDELARATRELTAKIGSLPRAIGCRPAE